MKAGPDKRSLHIVDAKLDRFFDELSSCCNVVEAARRSGMTLDEVSAHARDDPLYAERWQAALTAAYHALELEMLERARFGNPDAKKYNDAFSLRLLLQHRAEQASAAPTGPAVSRTRLQSLTDRLRPAIEAAEKNGGSDELR